MTVKAKIAIRRGNDKIKIKMEGKEAKELAQQLQPDIQQIPQKKEPILYRTTTRPKL